MCGLLRKYFILPGAFSDITGLQEHRPSLTAAPIQTRSEAIFFSHCARINEL